MNEIAERVDGEITKPPFAQRFMGSAKKIILNIRNLGRNNLYGKLGSSRLSYRDNECTPYFI